MKRTQQKRRSNKNPRKKVNWTKIIELAILIVKAIIEVVKKF